MSRCTECTGAPHAVTGVAQPLLCLRDLSGEECTVYRLVSSELGAGSRVKQNVSNPVNPATPAIE